MIASYVDRISYFLVARPEIRTFEDLPGQKETKSISSGLA